MPTCCRLFLRRPTCRGDYFTSLLLRAVYTLSVCWNCSYLITATITAQTSLTACRGATKWLILKHGGLYVAKKTSRGKIISGSKLHPGRDQHQNVRGVNGVARLWEWQGWSGRGVNRVARLWEWLDSSLMTLLTVKDGCVSVCQPRGSHDGIAWPQDRCCKYPDGKHSDGETTGCVWRLLLSRRCIILMLYCLIIEKFRLQCFDTVGLTSESAFGHVK